MELEIPCIAIHVGLLLDDDLSSRRMVDEGRGGGHAGGLTEGRQFERRTRAAFHGHGPTGQDVAVDRVVVVSRAAIGDVPGIVGAVIVQRAVRVQHLQRHRFAQRESAGVDDGHFTFRVVHLVRPGGGGQQRARFQMLQLPDRHARSPSIPTATRPPQLLELRKLPINRRAESIRPNHGSPLNVPVETSRNVVHQSGSTSALGHSRTRGQSDRRRSRPWGGPSPGCHCDPRGATYQNS